MTATTNSKQSALDAGVVKIGHFRVNRLGFGAMRLTGTGVWGSPADVDAAKAVLVQAVTQDVNFIDTADAYGPEVSEQLIHDALYPYDGVIIATKGGLLRGGPDNWYPDGSPQHLRTACEASLRRLAVSRIMLYQLHRPDPAVPFVDSVRALVDMQREGMIRHIGLSNVTLDQLKTGLELTNVVSVQNQYNVSHRRDSDEIVDFCEQHNIAFIPWYPIGGGGTPAGQHVMQAVAARHDASEYQIALAWLLARSKTMLPIPGTSSLDHLEENIAAASIKLTAADIAQLDSLSD